MSRPMDMKEFAALVNFIKKHHSPFSTEPPASGSRKTIKYIDPHIDMRSFTCFSISFRGFGGEKNFNCQNECMELPESLYERCMTWLAMEQWG